MSSVHFIIESRMTNSDAHTAMKSIVAQQRAAVVKAWKLTMQSHRYYGEQEEFVNGVIKEYRATLVPSIIKLHSLGYPIISFYIDHLIYIHVRNEPRYKSVLHTLRRHLHHYQGRTKLCSQKLLQERSIPELCGIVHIRNIHDPVTVQYVHQKRNIRVPHMFYIHIQFLEVLLVGGVSEHACNSYQSIIIWCRTVYPFTTMFSEQQRLTFCGSHPPFTTIMPGNLVTIEAISAVTNRLASIKVKFTAVDMLVSLIMLDTMQITVA